VSLRTHWCPKGCGKRVFFTGKLDYTSFGIGASGIFKCDICNNTFTKKELVENNCFKG
jgi:hypothetical protein